MLLTNDGALTNALLHPRYHVPKRYRVWVDGSVGPVEVSRLREGIDLDDGPTEPAKVEVLESHREQTTLEITLYEGRKRQIRRMCEAVGHRVSRLLRTAIGPLQLGSLASGEYRRLGPDEVRALLEAAGASRPSEE
jgi:pseudouridine synthase